MSARFTPGPWEPEMGYAGSFEMLGRDSESGATLVICSRGIWTHRAEMSLANARLIAAAPTMYAIVERLARISDGLANSNQAAEDIAADLARDAAALVAQIEGGA